jgi:hypothetical protein
VVRRGRNKMYYTLHPWQLVDTLLCIYNGFKFWFVSAWRTTIPSLGLIRVDMSGEEWSKLMLQIYMRQNSVSV